MAPPLEMYVSHYLRIVLRVDVPLTPILGAYTSNRRIVHPKSVVLVISTK
jgi:hypothetical protein